MLEVKVEEIDCGWRHKQELIVTHNGKEILRETDGGEPEDQSFYRDWSWVKPAIEKAYQLGREDMANIFVKDFSV